jgi:SHS family lactate transporter-like MFS transporter
MAAAEAVSEGARVAWWKEPTREQWHAWIAAWLGWTLDSFDFTVFLLLMLPIAQTFHVPLVDVTAVLALTLWMRLVGATISGWLADRLGRKTPLMISIAWYSIANLLAGLAPSFFLLFLFRALLGIGMGAEWPVGAALAMEQWPVRSRGFMSGVLQGSWGLGALLSSLAYGLLYNWVGWRGLLIIGVLPAFAIIYVRRHVKEPEVWLENRRRQRAERREIRVPLLSIFKPAILANTATACWWMASSFVVAYSITAMFATWLQKDMHLSPALVALPVTLYSLGQFGSGVSWGWVADRLGRRWAMILPALIGIPLVPLYLFTHSYAMIVVFFGLQGWFAGGGIWSQAPSYLAERFPTEVRATASGFCYHQGAIWGGFAGPVVTYFAINWHLGFAIPMAIGTLGGLLSLLLALSVSPETHGKELGADIVLA